MSFYPVQSSAANVEPGELGGWPGGTAMIAVRAADLVSPAGRRLGEDDRSALAVGGTAKIRSGDVVGVLQGGGGRPGEGPAGRPGPGAGQPCDHARLGAAEERLEEMAGPGAVGALARRTRLADPVTGARTRLLTREFVLRAIVLMTLMPDADYTEVMTALAGDLAAVPWATAWHVPSPRVFSGWRRAVGPGSLEDLQDAVLRSAVAEHRQHDYRAVLVGDLRAGSADGTLTRMPDTAANRAAFGSAGTSDDSGPYPQLRALLLTDASTRTTLGAVHGPSGGDKADGEQKLLDKAMDEFPHLFTSDRIWIMDRNFPGAKRISRLIGCTHVLIRVKSDIRLPRPASSCPTGPTWQISPAAASPCGSVSSSTGSKSRASTSRNCSA